MIICSYNNSYPRLRIQKTRRYWVVCLGIFSTSHCAYATVWEMLLLMEGEVDFRFCFNCSDW
jgi:hypothetical protein